MSSTEKYSPKDHVKKRRSRCGQCGPCQVKEDCGKCKYCLNKQVLKQSCMYRKCLYLRCKNRSSFDASLSESELSKSGEFMVSSPTSTVPHSPLFGAPMPQSHHGGYGPMSPQMVHPFMTHGGDSSAVTKEDFLHNESIQSDTSSTSEPNWTEPTTIKTETLGVKTEPNTEETHQLVSQSEGVKMSEFLHNKPIPSPAYSSGLPGHIPSHGMLHSMSHGIPHGLTQNSHPHCVPNWVSPAGHPGDRMMLSPPGVPGLIPPHGMNGMHSPHMFHNAPWAYPVQMPGMPVCSERISYHPRTTAPQIGGPLLAGLGPPPSPSIVPVEMYGMRHPGEIPISIQTTQEECVISIDNAIIPAFVQTDGLNNVEITTAPSLGGKDILSAAIEESGISDLAQEASMENEMHQTLILSSETIHAKSETGNKENAGKQSVMEEDSIVLHQNLGSDGEIQINLPSNGFTIENVTIDEDLTKYSSNNDMLVYPGDIFAHQVM